MPFIIIITIYNCGIIKRNSKNRCHDLAFQSYITTNCDYDSLKKYFIFALTNEIVQSSLIQKIQKKP